MSAQICVVLCFSSLFHEHFLVYYKEKGHPVSDISIDVTGDHGRLISLIVIMNIVFCVCSHDFVE